jgi:hypothetical protein
LSFFPPRHGKRDITSSFSNHLGYKFFISPGEGERGIIFCGHIVLSIHPRRELDPASMASHGVPADWVSLPNNLVKKIGDIFLSMYDFDYYCNLRAVCGALPAELPFMLTKWINLEPSLSRDDLVNDATVTLLNVSTGRDTSQTYL